MLTKRIIPCLDIDRGRVVKGVQFLDLKDAGNPSELAAKYDNEGADELVFLDITASSDNRDIMIDVVKDVSEQVFIPLTVGGGLGSLSDIRKMLESGADKVSLNTAAVLSPRLISDSSKFFGSQCIVVAIDAKRISASDQEIGFEKEDSLSLEPSSQWELFTHGGRRKSGMDVVKWAKHVADAGAGELLVTSMDTDGQKTGYDLELLRTITDSVSIPVIASGGAGNLDHLYQALNYANVDAVLAASIFHFGNYRITDAKEYLSQRGLPIRPPVTSHITPII